MVNVQLESNATALADVVSYWISDLIKRTRNRILFCDFREKHEG